MQFHTNISSCHLIPVIFENMKVYSVQPNYWVIDSKTEKTQFCDNEVSLEIIKGTYILTVDDNCKVEIEGFSVKKHQTWEKT